MELFNQIQQNPETVGIGATILYILLVIAYWKIFRKAGEPGIKSLIPVYNTYTQYRSSWRPGPFFVFAICLTAGVLLPQYYPDSTLLLRVSQAGLFIASVIRLISLYKLSRCFGHGLLFTAGLYFLPNLFLLILGFGSSRYQRSHV